MKDLVRFCGWMVLASLALGAGWAYGQIAGSKHDFSHEAWSEDDQCGACHTPHRDDPPLAAPLWEPSADLSKRFGTPAETSEFAGRGTVVCLSCHDGTVASDRIPKEIFKTLEDGRAPRMIRRGHGSSDHPVGVRYPQIDRGFHPVTSVIAKGTVTLPDGRVECISCHDPHNTAGTEHMLVQDNARSALCLTCHKK